jgi:hypothetical protein
MDRSNRPPSCPHQASAEVETQVCELRREHPRWGPRRIAHELAASTPKGSTPPGKIDGAPHPAPPRFDRAGPPTA